MMSKERVSQIEPVQYEARVKDLCAHPAGRQLIALLQAADEKELKLILRFSENLLK